MKILIATSIYPPEIGGPAEYAKNLKDVWVNEGHDVSVRIFSKFMWIPWGIRHVLFLFYILPAVRRVDYILTLDAFNAGVVVVAGKLLGKKVILRTGGDTLWEFYVERTGEMVLLKDFYQTCLHKFSFKEKLTFVLLRWGLQNLSAIIWSTEWQRDIFLEPYGLQSQRHFIIENYYGKKLSPYGSESGNLEKNFIGGTRRLKWKNIELVEEVFERSDVRATGAYLDTDTVPKEEFLEKIRSSYAVILASLGDISPNTILDAIRCGKPFIVTKEVGIYERIKDCAVFVDPKDEEDITQKIVWLCDEKNYALQRQRVINFTFTHEWDEMAKEYMDIWTQIM